MPPAPTSRARATTRCTAPGRCAAPSSARSRTRWPSAPGRRVHPGRHGPDRRPRGVARLREGRRRSRAGEGHGVRRSADRSGLNWRPSQMQPMASAASHSETRAHRIANRRTRPMTFPRSSKSVVRPARTLTEARTERRSSATRPRFGSRPSISVHDGGRIIGRDRQLIGDLLERPGHARKRPLAKDVHPQRADELPRARLQLARASGRCRPPSRARSRVSSWWTPSCRP